MSNTHESSVSPAEWLEQVESSDPLPPRRHGWLALAAVLSLIMLLEALRKSL